MKNYHFIFFIFISIFLYIISPHFANIRNEPFKIVAKIKRKSPLLINTKIDKVQILRHKLNLLRMELYKTKEQLRNLTKFREKFDTNSTPIVIPAKILIKRDISNNRHSFIIDKGKNSGVEPGAVAVYGVNLVGRIIEVSSTISKGVYISDPSIRIGINLIEFKKKEEIRYGEGICVGVNGEYCSIKFLEKNEGAVWKKAQVVTSGFKAEYPTGLILGEVEFPDKEDKEESSEKAGYFWNLEFKPINLDNINSILIIKK